MLSEQEKTEILRLGRAAIETYLRERRFTPVEPASDRLRRKAGAFVTLQKQGQLRGCIGHLAANKPLCLVVQEMAIAAATSDPRFPSLTLPELPDVSVEISVLSAFQKVKHESEIQVGLHGLIVGLGERRGLLLPQVAREQRWDVPTFLAATCRKAGLPLDAWKRGATIEIFTAEVFSELE